MLNESFKCQQQLNVTRSYEVVVGIWISWNHRFQVQFVYREQLNSPTLYIGFKTYGADHMKENLYASLAEKSNSTRQIV